MTDNNPSSLLLSRRSFLLGAGAVAAGAAAFAYGCQNAKGEEPAPVADTGEGTTPVADVSTIDTQLGDVAILSVADDSVITTDDCKYIKNPSKSFKRVAQAHLPYGTLIWANDDKVAACLLPCETSKPLAQIGLLSLSSGNLNVARKNAVGEEEGFEIYDVRANSNGAVWLEANIMEDKWRVYAAKTRASGSVLGKAQLVAEGGGEWETPHLAVCDSFAFWQLSPANTQAASSSSSSAAASSKEDVEIPESSLLMRVKFGASMDDAKVVYEAPGRMACAPTPSQSGICIAPRANINKKSGSYYQLTHVDASSGTVDSALALPASMKPNYIAYGPTGFSFAFESIYNFGDGISNLGTYTSTGQGPESDDKPFGEWFRFSRSPYTAPAWAGDWFVVKSTGVVAGIDLKNRQYFSIDPEHAMQDYGEYLASSGAGNRVVTYSNIDYTPVGGDRIYECNVRVWKPL